MVKCAKRQRQTGQHGPSKKVTWQGQSGIEIGVNYKLEWFKKEWEEKKSRENNNLLQRGTENGLRGKKSRKVFFSFFKI